MPKKKLLNVHYIGIALATVLFWRAVWSVMDRIALFDSFVADIATGAVGLGILWVLTKSFKHLD